jgi:hypothetical protein
MQKDGFSLPSSSFQTEIIQKNYMQKDSFALPSCSQTEYKCSKLLFVFVKENKQTHIRIM